MKWEHWIPRHWHVQETSDSAGIPINECLATSYGSNRDTEQQPYNTELDGNVSGYMVFHATAHLRKYRLELQAKSHRNGSRNCFPFQQCLSCIPTSSTCSEANSRFAVPTATWKKFKRYHQNDNECGWSLAHRTRFPGYISATTPT